MDFIVIDTEGSPALRELAVLDSQGQLLYEAFVAEHPAHANSYRPLKPLRAIVQDITRLARNKSVVCHYAQHDLDVLQGSFRQANMPWIRFKTLCTWELAKQHLPPFESYSLAHLSQCLQLQVNGRRFNAEQAHTAHYDAAFTHQLYLTILEHQQRRALPTPSPHTPNPYSSSRVDNPFQDHLDLQAVYQAEFALLKAALGDVKADPNQQSKGAVILGAAGSGKTHLIMRLAKELLRTNRLLFIRQPNNATAVLHHTYSRILESLAEPVAGSDRTQLELLLANSFVNILSSLEQVTGTQKGREILAAFQENSLQLYSRSGTEETQRHRARWEYIERHITEWWGRHYTAAGDAVTILRGIIKFCSYSDPHKKDLVRRWLAASELETAEAESIGLENWQEDMSREEFALAAITVFGRLSTLDEPLIIVFDQLESLGLPHNTLILESFGAAVKELLTHVPHSLIILNLFPERWEQFQSCFDGSVVDRVSDYIVPLERPSAAQLEALLSLRAQAVGLEWQTLFTPSARASILSQPSIRAVLKQAGAYFHARVHNTPLPRPTDAATPLAERSVTARLHQLEQVMAQMVSLLQPYWSSLSPSDLPSSRAEVAPLGLSPPDAESLPPDLDTTSAPVSVAAVVADYLSQKRLALAADYTRPTIIQDANEIGKLAAIAAAFQLHQALEFEPLRVGRSKLPEHLRIRTAQQEFVIGFLNASGTTFTARIKNFNQLVALHPEIKFTLLRDGREPKLTGAVGLAEIEKLQHSPNGQFQVMTPDDRISFELIYNCIIDIQEQDLEVALALALPLLLDSLSDYWLMAALRGQPLHA
ncbi:exonuclease [Leptolyngbya sp. FACHB-321]|uniref:exonuclease n=1 Tax=Leptolyngbya sp. FACHB-321 TaxID=2692807 RepID=UPI001689E52F|nr:exonuclease [Leptolyngbya sp. FACHB-321]MBD2038287.1 exonuclease [Leptolyngbya sp. FACHB-321]